ncbi:MAG TPA: hypothetical protein VLA45_07015, partial [Paracoccaceae bacterium]|nr:hypothetical protein [Paracoccaceae bacterium]
GYGMAQDVPVVRLSVIALLGSLGQAVTAIVLAYGGLWILDLGRDRMIDAAENAFAPVSYVLIAAIGIWLAVRGLRGLRRQSAVADHVHQGADDICSSCGHRHGPTLQEAQEATGLRDALVLIGGIAIRPCTGALFVLIICWQMGIPLVGVAASFAMAIGTATVTVAVAAAARGVRGGLLSGIRGAASLVWVMPLVEVATGLLVTVLSLMLLLRALQ